MRTQKGIDDSRKAIELKLRGMTYAEIGQQLGVTRQRAQQLTKPPKRVYEMVRQRAGGACELCGFELQSGHVHHKGGSFENYNDPDNLQYLCLSCHVKQHESKLPGEYDWKRSLKMRTTKAARYGHKL